MVGICELTSQVTNFTNNFNLIDQQIETVQQKQTALASRDDAIDTRLERVERKTIKPIPRNFGNRNTALFLFEDFNDIKLHPIDSKSKKVKTVTFSAF